MSYLIFFCLNGVANAMSGDNQGVLAKLFGPIRRGVKDPITLNLWILLLASSAFGGFFVDVITCTTAGDGCTNKRIWTDAACIVAFGLWVLWLLQMDAQYVRPVFFGVNTQTAKGQGQAPAVSHTTQAFGWPFDPNGGIL